MSTDIIKKTEQPLGPAAGQLTGLYGNTAKCVLKEASTQFSPREVCSENKITTTKYPCLKSSGELTTCFSS
ncbi:rCG46976, isoform CRA_d [Rattus norvegicus]|uniref:RCG46976, isoform CRA_d n=1 Tax=Rattus norvegicus TaxID=10116 RepID=A6IXS8_RAT|nr:rCG46976, isoform CRA_d [Rattus norvegicus]